MTFITIHEPTQRDVSSWWRSTVNVVGRFAAAIRQSMEISRRRRELQQMPDNLLKDIGISRSEIDYITDAMVNGRDDVTRRPRGVVTN